MLAKVAKGTVGRYALLSCVALRFLNYAITQPGERKASVDLSNAGCKYVETPPSAGTGGSFPNPGTAIRLSFEPGSGPFLKPDSGAILPTPPHTCGRKSGPILEPFSGFKIGPFFRFVGTIFRTDFGAIFRPQNQARFLNPLYLIRRGGFKKRPCFYVGKWLQNQAGKWF